MYVKFVKRSKQLKIRCGTVLCRYRIVSRFLCIRKKLPLAGSADAGSLAEYDFHKKSFNFSMLYSSNFRSLSIRSRILGSASSYWRYFWIASTMPMLLPVISMLAMCETDGSVILSFRIPTKGYSRLHSAETGTVTL